MQRTVSRKRRKIGHANRHRARAKLRKVQRKRFKLHRG